MSKRRSEPIDPLPTTHYECDCLELKLDEDDLPIDSTVPQLLMASAEKLDAVARAVCRSVYEWVCAYGDLSQFPEDESEFLVEANMEGLGVAKDEVYRALVYASANELPDPHFDCLMALSQVLFVRCVHGPWPVIDKARWQQLANYEEPSTGGW